MYQKSKTSINILTKLTTKSTIKQPVSHKDDREITVL